MRSCPVQNSPCRLLQHTADHQSPFRIDRRALYLHTCWGESFAGRRSAAGLKTLCSLAGRPIHTHEMIATHPDVRGNVNEAFIEAIDEAYACAQTCTSCADACLAEEKVTELRQCIRLNLDCADVCAGTATLATAELVRTKKSIRTMLEACITACRLCGEECQRHASMHERCRICADSCRRCEAACQSALGTM